MKFFLVSFFLIVGITVYSQKLDDQFQLMNESSQTFKDYKVIKINELNDFWKIVMDSIQTNRDFNTGIISKNKAQEEEITQLKEMLSKNNMTAQSMEYETSHINVLGVSLSKTSYKIINFAVIIALIIGSAFLFLNFQERVRTARVKIKAFETLESDFEEYKKVALEKQMKLRRELQTERNRLEKIRST
jgi:hypothetical protein